MKPEPTRMLQEPEDDPGFAESARFEARSVTGASYTIVEQTCVDVDASHADCDDCDSRRYRTAYAGLPVVANDDGSYTIVDTHTRLVRVEHL